MDPTVVVYRGLAARSQHEACLLALDEGGLMTKETQGAPIAGQILLELL